MAVHRSWTVLAVSMLEVCQLPLLRSRDHTAFLLQHDGNRGRWWTLGNQEEEHNRTSDFRAFFSGCSTFVRVWVCAYFCPDKLAGTLICAKQAWLARTDILTSQHSFSQSTQIGIFFPSIHLY